MNERQKVIVFALNALEIPLKVDTLDDRKALQKAIYLAQEAGVDLGYPYGWHQMGPYSHELAEDYRQAAYTIGMGSAQNVRPLRRRYREALASLRPTLNPPKDIPLSKTQWLELMASLHFLRKYVGQSVRQAHTTIHQQKRNLSKYSSAAEAELARAGLA